MKDQDIKIGVVVREGRKIKYSYNLNKEQVTLLLLQHCDDASVAMAVFSKLREGLTHKFKLSGYGVTLQPLHNHIDYY